MAKKSKDTSDYVKKIMASNYYNLLLCYATYSSDVKSYKLSDGKSCT